MGEAFVGIADDSNAVVYNPAGLHLVYGLQGSIGLAAEEETWGGNGQFVYPLRKFGALGARIFKGEEESHEIVLGYGRRLTRKLNIGFGVEYYNLEWGKHRISTHYTLTEGLLYLLFKNFSVGAVFFQEINPSGVGNIFILPKIGLGYITNTLTLACDFGMTRHGWFYEGDINLGVEKWLFDDSFAIRGGVQANGYYSFSIGGSYRLLQISPNLQFDYAYVRSWHGNWAHYFSVSFGKGRKWGHLFRTL